MDPGVGRRRGAVALCPGENSFADSVFGPDEIFIPNGGNSAGGCVAAFLALAQSVDKLEGLDDSVDARHFGRQQSAGIFSLYAVGLGLAAK